MIAFEGIKKNVKLEYAVTIETLTLLKMSFIWCYTLKNDTNKLFVDQLLSPHNQKQYFQLFFYILHFTPPRLCLYFIYENRFLFSKD